MEKPNATAIVFDDHLLFADSFAALIERLNLFSDVHTLNDKRELTQFLIKHPKTPVYLFLDYYLKNENGLMLINEIKRLNRQLRIIIMSSTLSPAVVTNILDYKPHGFISKSSGFDTILQCLETITHRHQYICPIISKIVDHRDNTKKISFTSRELEILQHFAKGLSIAHTAEKTYLSKHTIVAHRRNMMAKVNVNSITELLSYAREQELI
nr:response regulator transcription factor [Pedobacter sp. ASV19]